MDWDYVEHRLQRAFLAWPRYFGATRVTERRRPFLLARVMNEALTEEEQEWGDLESWPGSLMELLDQNGICKHRLLSFNWESLGPMSWVAGLELIGNGTRRHLCYWDEIGSYRAVAALEPWDDPLALSGTVARLLSRNGTGFGLSLFGTLPSETTNYAPELLSEASIRQAYFDLMQWWEFERGGAWLELMEEHYGRMVEPNHLQRSLDLLQTLPRLDDGDAISQWLDEREAVSGALPDEVRQQLFDEWFSTSYEEAQNSKLRG